MKVLMVDDEVNLLSSYRRLLSGSFDLVTVDSPEKALDLIKSEGPFAVVVSDYKMPKMNGVEMLKQVRALAPDTVRIMLTGQGDLSIAIDAINHGSIFRFMVKPCPHEQLLHSINEGLYQYEAASKKHEIVRKEVLEAFYQKSLYGTFKMISALLERKDPYTASHQLRVSQLAEAIAREMQFDNQTIECVRISANLHDIGKIYTPTEILSKPGKLSELEFNLIKDHARAGYELLSEIELPWPIADIIWQHHERWDGSGYPLGLKADDILIEARIIGVADVVEAITAHRPYRAALGLDSAVFEIQRHKGSHFDPVVVDACLRVLDEKSFSWG